MLQKIPGCVRNHSEKYAKQNPKEEQKKQQEKYIFRKVKKFDWVIQF